MAARNDGGPAFPKEVHHMGPSGMSLRDFFAAHALAGMLAERWEAPRDVSERAYDVADAMLKEREARDG